jgi:hypothetical protein
MGLRPLRPPGRWGAGRSPGCTEDPEDQGPPDDPGRRRPSLWTAGEERPLTVTSSRHSYGHSTIARTPVQKVRFREPIVKNHPVTHGRRRYRAARCESSP